MEAVNFEGEKRLMLEVLKDAIECWRSSRLTRKDERLRREAHFWLFGDYEISPRFSFKQICDSLKLDPDFIRRCLLEERRSGRLSAVSQTLWS
jgi:hypothetical protein